VSNATSISTDKAARTASFWVIKLVDRRNKQILDFIVRQVRCGTFRIVIVLVVALPDGFAVLAVGVPSLGAVPLTADRAIDGGHAGKTDVHLLGGVIGLYSAVDVDEHGSGGFMGGIPIAFFKVNVYTVTPGVFFMIRTS